MMNPVAFIKQLINPETGKPFDLLPAERAFLKHAFTLGPDGRLLYPELVYSCPKKSGKTAFAAMLLLYCTLNFGKFGEGYALATNLEQAQGRVFSAVKAIVEATPMLRRQANITASRIEFSDPKCTITAIASDAAGVAGSNPVISTFDELWGYTSERFRRIWMNKSRRPLESMPAA
jgi:phage terminase large subunit-like protein